MGQVVTVDPTISRPVVVEVYEPQANPSGSLSRARFRKAIDEDSGEPKVDNITLHQIQMTFPKLTSRGYLSPKDRKTLEQCLES